MTHDRRLIRVPLCYYYILIILYLRLFEVTAVLVNRYTTVTTGIIYYTEPSVTRPDRSNRNNIIGG